MRHDLGLKKVVFLLLVSMSALAREKAPEPLVPPTFPAALPLQFGESAFPSWEFGGGYNFLRVLEGADTNYPIGWNGSIAKNLNQTIGIVGEISGNHDRAEGVATDIYSFLGGARFSFRGETITPFFSVLGGVTRSSVSVDFVDPLFSLTFDESANELTFLGGGGIDVTLADNWALRAGADIQRVSSDGESGDLFRIQAGVIYRAGTSSSFRSAPPVSVQPVSPSFGGQGGAPLNEVSVEYAFLRELDEGGGNVPFGWNVSYARNLSPSFGLVGEIGTALETEGDVTASLWDFMGGVRFSSRGAATTYVEALGGMAFLAVTDGTTLETISKPAIQGGGGVDLKISPSVAIRAGADYRAIFSEGDVFSQLRIRAGLIFGFGGTTADETVAAAPPPPRYQEPERPTPPPREPLRTEPPPPEPVGPTRAAPPREAEPPTAPPPPASDFDRGHSLLRQGDYELAAVAFMVHLRQEGSGKFTVAVGLFCERNNVAAHVVNSGYAPEFFIVNIPRSGGNCFGGYWGLYDSRDQAQEAMGALPSAIRAPGQLVLPVSRVVR